MNENDEPVNLDKLSADWLKELADGEYQRADLAAHELAQRLRAERLHFEREERRNRRRRRRRSSWEHWEDFES